jgi:hypothetical protein
VKICYSRPSSKGFPCSVDLSKILQTISAKNRDKKRPSEDRDRDRDIERARSVSASACASAKGGDVSSNGIELNDVRKCNGNGYKSSALHCADDVESVLDDTMRRGGRGGGEGEGGGEEEGGEGGEGDNELNSSDAGLNLENLHVSDSLDDGLEW